MYTKSAVRFDLNRLRKLCKSIRTIEGWHINSGEPLQGSPLEGQLNEFVINRNKILEKYRPDIDALSSEENMIFTLYYLQGLTQKETAVKTNYCKSSITKHLSIIINKLR